MAGLMEDGWLADGWMVAKPVVASCQAAQAATAVPTMVQYWRHWVTGGVSVPKKISKEGVWKGKEGFEATAARQATRGMAADHQGF